MTLNDRLGDILDPYVPDEQKVVLTNLIKAAIVHHLPPPVDIDSKYETDALTGLNVMFNGDKRHDEKMLEMVLSYGQDCGYNFYWRDARESLKLDNTVVS